MWDSVWDMGDEDECVSAADSVGAAGSSGNINLTVWTSEDDVRLPPTVLNSMSLLGDPDAWHESTAAYIDIQRATEGAFAISTAARISLCLEEVVGPVGFDGNSPADWHGTVYVQVLEWWESGDIITHSGSGCGARPLPTDFFITLDGMGCSWGEDASWYNDTDYCLNWGSECDGIDNDLDGVVDEGQHAEEMDQDDNGVVDCMDDWDGDGIPNTDDEDVDECCCDDDDY